MKRDELKARFNELLEKYPPLEEIERLSKIIYHAILLNMAEQCRPFSLENRKEAENLLLFL